MAIQGNLGTARPDGWVVFFDLDQPSIKGLLLRKGTSVQIDTDAQPTTKRGKEYFGYKDHIGIDAGSDLIRKRKLTSARPHDSQLKE